MVFSFKKKKTQEYSCPKCGRKWLGSVGGYNPKNPQENPESFRNFLEHQESEKCPFCEPREQKPDISKAKEKSIIIGFRGRFPDPESEREINGTGKTKSLYFNHAKNHIG